MAGGVLRPSVPPPGGLTLGRAADAHHEKGDRPVALVTGGAIRVGRAIALRLAEAGHDVAITYNTSRGPADETVGAIEAKGVRGVALQCDLSDMQAASALPARVAEALTRLDVVVNNASVFFRTPVGGVVEEEWDDLFTLNAKAPFFVSQAAVPFLKYDDPCIVNLIDVSAERAYPGYIPYCASKAALKAMTEGLAKALAPKVRVNGVAPGPVLPPEDYDEAALKRASDATLLKRWGSPEDVAEAVTFLVTNRYLTGVVVPVDGGRRVA